MRRPTEHQQKAAMKSSGSKTGTLPVPGCAWKFSPLKLRPEPVTKGQLYQSPACTGIRSDVLRAMRTKLLPRATKQGGGWLGNLPVKGVEAVQCSTSGTKPHPSSWLTIGGILSGTLEVSFPRKPEDCEHALEPPSGTRCRGRSPGQPRDPRAWPPRSSRPTLVT